MSDAPAPRRAVLPWVVALVALLGVLALIGWAWSRRRPRDHWAEVAKARAFLERGRPDLAFQAVSGIRDEAPGAAEALALAARVLLMYGDTLTARRALERSLKLNPDQADAAKALAAIYLATGDGPRGVTLLERAARLDPRDFRPWYAMAKVQHDMGELSKAADAYGQALRRSPPAAEAREARLGRIRALLEANRAEEAAADLKKARQLAPDDPRVLGLAARQARALGRTTEALELADRALAGDPDDLDALVTRASLRYLSGRPEPALADLERAIRINPNHLGALQLLVQVQSRLGLAEQAAATRQRFGRASQRVEAMDRLTREINQRPDDPEPRWRMGQAAVEGGMDALAYQCFRAALDLDPNYKPAREALAALRASGRITPDMTRRPTSAAMIGPATR
jgi:tetratricopeptide (TPR) repeat protein